MITEEEKNEEVNKLNMENMSGMDNLNMNNTSLNVDQMEMDDQLNDLNNRSNASDYDVPLNIRTHLIKPKDTTKKPGNRLIEDYNYDKTGTNGIFEISPAIVKIAGFEVNKKQKIKVQIINKSKFSQRITLIPPTSPYFKINFSRRGAIPCGLSETIIITFTPQTYQYYYDFIRVNCEGEKLLIPIHAYPRMNMNIKEYVPKYIDFGTIAINSYDTRELVLKNTIPMIFEYEFVPVKVCEEISIEPVYGDIENNASKYILVTFSPRSSGIFISEYMFKLSEFEHKPFKVQISGTCNVFDKVMQENIHKHHKKIETLKKANASFKDSYNQNLQISKIREDESKITSEDKNAKAGPNLLQAIKTLDSNISGVLDEKSSSMINQSAEKGLSKKFKIFPSNKEREFLNYYNQIEGTIKDKEIKYLRFPGKRLLTEDEVNKIKSDKNDDIESATQLKKKIDVDRHFTELDSEKPIVDIDNKYLLKPTFDLNNNDKFFKTRHYYNCFLKIMTKQLIQNRANKRIEMLKDMIVKNGIKSTSDWSEYVKNDWNHYLLMDTENEDFSTKIKFIEPKSLVRPPVFLSNEYNIDSLKQAINHENNIVFDDLREYLEFERSDAEVIGYKELKSNGLTQYEIKTDEKILRQGAESDFILRGERGDSDLIYEKVDELLTMPTSFTKHIETQIDTLLFTNPSLKKYSEYNRYPETAIDFNLQARELPTEKNVFNHYSYDLAKTLPLSIYDKIEYRELDNNSLIYDNYLDFIPQRKKAPNERDFFIKKKDIIDEDNYIYPINKEDENKLLENLEKDDDVIKAVRELNKNDIYDAKKAEEENLNNFLMVQKKKWMLIVPTVLEYYNSGVNNPNNKFLL